MKVELAATDAALDPKQKTRLAQENGVQTKTAELDQSKSLQDKLKQS
jgi:hypothetical protein